MAIKSVADSPFFATASAELARAGAIARKVPIKYYRVGLIALASLWACHTLASLFWVILAPPPLPVLQVTPTGVSVDTSTRKSVAIGPTQNLNLFGNFNAAQQAEAPPPDETQNLPLAQLSVELLGIISANDPDRSWAILGRGDDQKLYKIGDEIDGNRGVKVAKIYDLKIIVNNNGKSEELWLYGEDGSKLASRTPSNYRPEPRSSVEPAIVNASQLQQAKNIGDVVRFMVATENGKMIGYKVRPGRQRELFDQVGLKTDDIVVSVNGIEVNEPSKVREVYQALKTATEANLQVLRDGSTHSIQITMNTEG